jgi:hypothetical protein
VQSNENLYRISVKLYGTPNRADEIYELNQAKIGDDPASSRCVRSELPARRRRRRRKPTSRFDGDR